MVNFTTFEDKLIKKYWEDNPGKLFMEVPVGKVRNRKRRIDAILIPGKENKYYDNNSNIEEEITGKEVHVIEAKRRLGRNVIGQIEVGKYLVKSDFNSAKVKPVILCGKLHSDLEEYCESQNIKVVKYDIETGNQNHKNKSKTDTAESIKVSDNRNPPDTYRLGAFKKGWKDAVTGELYQSIKTKKTHANMGNLFGWIYGESSDDVKEEIWEQYIENNINYFEKEWTPE